MEEWKNPETIILWIAIAALFLSVFIVFIILLVRAFFQNIVKTKEAESKAKLEYQKSLLETTIITQEKERKRIASDLHDELIGKLTVLKLQQEINYPHETDTISLLNESIQTSRRISHDLSPPLLESSTLFTLLNTMVSPWKEHYNVHIYHDIRSEHKFKNKFKIQVIRVIQELITNIAKHARATEININYRQTKNFLVISVSDNGVGYKIDPNKKGLGLKNIESRVHYLNGIFKTKSVINQGTSTLFLFKTMYNE